MRLDTREQVEDAFEDDDEVTIIWLVSEYSTTIGEIDKLTSIGSSMMLENWGTCSWSRLNTDLEIYSTDWEADDRKEELLKKANSNAWCVKITEKNISFVKKFINDPTFSFSIGAHYGVDENGKKDGSWTSAAFNRNVISDEEFFENHFSYLYPMQTPVRFSERIEEKGTVSDYYIYDPTIPISMITHGSIRFAENYDARVVGHYKEYYLVSYLDQNGKYVTLGFKEESLRPRGEQIFYKNTEEGEVKEIDNEDELIRVKVTSRVYDFDDEVD